MKAFHGNPKIKEKYLARVKAHAKADEIIKGQYWGMGKGCAIGCTIHSGNHKDYEIELGIPMILAKLEDRIFENIPMNLAKTWPQRFLKSITTGADLSLVWDRFASRLLTDSIGGVIQYAKTEDQIEAIQRVSDLYEAKIIGLEVNIQTWRDSQNAAAAAYAAADDAAADDAARTKAYIWQSELLLELLREAK